MNPAKLKCTRPSKPRRVVVLAFPEVELLDVTGPINVLSAAHRLRRGDRGYAIELAAPQSGPVSTAGGIALSATRAISTLRGDIDTLIVPGGVGVDRTGAVVVPHLERLARASRRVVGVCTGSFLLAEAGVLRGRRAVSHWAGCDALRARFPDVQVEDDAIFVRDGDVWTSAGVTAGMDLALALVEEDLGSPTALEVARWLVMYLRRPGGQSQFRVPLSAQSANDHTIQSLMAWVVEHPHEDLSVGALARRASMSPRNFARVFVAQTGSTPAAWVARVRLEAARTALEGSNRPVKQVAAECGYASTQRLYHAFQRAIGTTPTEYRSRFRMK